MTPGQRMKYFRKMSRMTQTQLAVAAGLPARHADVRITQYESGSKHPRKPLREALAKGLNVSPLAISPPDMESSGGIMHILFLMEDLYGMKIKGKHSRLCLVFDPERTDSELSEMMAAWLDKSRSVENGKLSKEDYDLWRYNVPDSIERAMASESCPNDQMSEAE